MRFLSVRRMPLHTRNTSISTSGLDAYRSAKETGEGQGPRAEERHGLGAVGISKLADTRQLPI